MFSGFFLVNYSINNQLFVHSCEQSSQFFTAQTQIRCYGWEGNFLITASSKDKTYCHDKMIYYTAFKNKNLLSISSKTSKPAVKTSKPSKPPVKIIKTIKTTCQNHQKHQNLLSFIIHPSKTKTTCQNHQNLLSKHQNHQNLLSKPSKPPVKIIKTSCQKHQNHLSKSSKPPVKNIKTTCQKHQNLLSL